MTHLHLFPPHMCTHTHIHQTSAESAHTHNTQQSVWREVTDVPYYRSSVCVVDGALLAIGGDGKEYRSKKTSSIYGLHLDEKMWRHVGDLPFACSMVDTLLLSGGGLFMVDGDAQQVLKITVQGKYCCTGIEIELI